MEPYKFEENIREKFEAREIEPSKNAWEKLDAQLDNHEESVGNKFTWMAIAAGFVGVLIISSFIFNQNSISGNSENNSLVEENVSIENPENIISQNDLNNNSLVSEEIVSEEKMDSKEVESNLKPIQKEAIAKNLPKKESLNKKREVIPINNLDDIAITVENASVDQKLNEVISEIKKLQNQNKTVSASEIDALLASAQRELKSEQVFNPRQKKVDARSLLQETEYLADRSFRDKIFVALGEGFEKVRTAVSERNQ